MWECPFAIGMCATIAGKPGIKLLRLSPLLTLAKCDILQSQDRPHSPEDVVGQWFVKLPLCQLEPVLITSWYDGE